TDRTVWGKDGIPRYHTQYNGFMGLIFFDSDDPRLLPWTTTKREVDVDDPLYRKALVPMKNLTRLFIAYTNQRKANLSVAKTIESEARPVPISGARPISALAFPKIPGAELVQVSTIQYKKPLEEI